MNNNIKNKVLATFITSLCRSTTKEAIPDAERNAHKTIVTSILDNYNFISNRLYLTKDDIIVPTKACLRAWHDQLNANRSVLVPFNIYDNSSELGEYVLQDRTNTEQRVILVNSGIEFLIKNAEVIINEPNKHQLKFMNNMGVLYNYLLDNTETGKQFAAQVAEEE